MKKGYSRNKKVFFRENRLFKERKFVHICVSDAQGENIQFKCFVAATIITQLNHTCDVTETVQLSSVPADEDSDISGGRDLRGPQHTGFPAHRDKSREWNVSKQTWNLC